MSSGETAVLEAGLQIIDRHSMMTLNMSQQQYRRF